jgi:hypothetical protein
MPRMEVVTARLTLAITSLLVAPLIALDGQPGIHDPSKYHFAYALNKPTSNVLFWAVTVVNAPTDLTDVRLAIGSNAASVWWVNGEEVIGIYNDRQSVIDDGVSRRLTLKRGGNVVRAAVLNGGGATDFCARFLDADDRPIRTVAVELPGGQR